MGDNSGIEWTDATWNPTSGCTKVSQGCKNCYAERVFPRAYAKSGRKFTDVAVHPERLDQPLRWTRPRRIFVDSMSDLFQESIPFAFIDRVFATMMLASHHTFQVLTKRPVRMLSYLTDPGVHERWNYIAELNLRRPAHFGGVTAEWFGKFSRNIWLGVSVEDQETADERIPVLLGTPACVRFLSMEPLLGPVDFSKVPGFNKCGSAGADLVRDFWVIVGGESGPNARPMHPEWARAIRDQCASAGVPFFFKQWGEWAYPSSEGSLLTGAEPLRLGKKLAGRYLDGDVHGEFPR